MIDKPSDRDFQIGRYQLASSSTASSQIVVVLDTATGKLWVREVVRGIGGDKNLLKTENQGKCLWEMD